MKKRIVICAVIVSLLATTSLITVHAAKNNATNEKTTNSSVVQSTATESTQEKSTSATTKVTAKSIAQAKEKATKAAKKTTTAPEIDTVIKGNKPSKILNSYKAAQSWSVKSASSSAYIEKIALDLNVYEDGVKTNKTVKRYGYFAIVNTSVGGIHMVTSKSTTGKTVTDAVSVSKAYGALVAVNNEMCDHSLDTYEGFLNAANDQSNATVIKDGAVAQSDRATPSLACYADGTWEYPVNVSPANAQALIASGIKNTVGYTYPLIWNGAKYKLPDTGKISTIWSDHYLQKSNSKKSIFNDHTVIGQIDADTYVFAVSDGFGQAYLAEYMLNDLGVQNAYWGNGGHCSVMYIKGYGAVNRKNDNHLCLTADVICVK